MTEQKTNERRHRRVHAGLLMVVRGEDHHGHRFEEQTTCYDISRTGASFSTERELEAGANLEVVITMEAGPRGGDFDTLARVVRVAEAKDGGGWEVGIQFVERRFPRIFVSESA
ncbi:MAG TPA: PilZ domain-containing protein [Candidatus Acidoferrales bacterium]